jgi:putative transposase
MYTQRYHTDLSDFEWAVLEPHFPPAQATGRPRRHTDREILNAIFYLRRSGCAWRLLPRDLPPWETVYHYFRIWRLSGLWEQLNAALRQRLRVQMGREPQPSAGVVDSQSVKTTGVGGPRGFDGGKKINGRKRHLLVDTQGLLIRVVVHPADVPDCDGIRLVLAEGQEPSLRLSHLWRDGSYKGRGKEWIAAPLAWTVSIVQHPPKPRGVWAPVDAVIDWAALRPPPGFGVFPRRWVVERTCAGLGQNRRLSTEYARLCASSEAFIYAAMVRLMTRRMAATATRQQTLGAAA